MNLLLFVITVILAQYTGLAIQDIHNMSWFSHTDNDIEVFYAKYCNICT